MKYTLMFYLDWFVGILPIILLIVLLTVFHWTTTKAAGVTLLITVVTSSIFFKAGAKLMMFEALKGLWNTAAILFIIFPAILLYEVIAEAGCIGAINAGIEKISPNELFKILTIGWVFAGFLQGITGFGVPVAICVPILMGIGVKPIPAVVISLLGQSWGNTFGTLAVAWDVLVDISGISGSDVTTTALYASALLWILNVTVGLLICWLYGKGQGIRQGLVFVIIVSLIHGGGELIVSQFNQSIAAFIPTTLALVSVFAISKLKVYKTEGKLQGSNIMRRKPEAKAEITCENNIKSIVAFSPYIVLVVVTVLLLAVEPINSFLSQWSLGFAFPETQTGQGYVNGAVDKYSPFCPFTDSGTVLLVTCIISYFILKKNKLFKSGAVKRILKRTIEKTKPSACSIALLLIISKLMSGTGQTLLIAQGITMALGSKYAIFSGFIGLIGSFITGSNMSSNILFTDVQVNAASNLGVKSSALLASQTSGAAVGSIISPSKIVLGTTAAESPGEEGAILKILLPVAIVLTFVIGIICRLII